MSAVVLAGAAFLWSALWPYAYRGATSTTTTDGAVIERSTHASLVAVNGAWVLSLLAVPLVLTIGGYVAVLLGHPVLVWLAAFLLLAFSIAGFASIGLFFTPATIALIVAAALVRRSRPGAGRAS